MDRTELLGRVNAAYLDWARTATTDDPPDSIYEQIEADRQADTGTDSVDVGP